MSTALFVDTYTRKIEVSTVSVSEVAGKGLVLRYGAKIGNLWQLTENSYGNLFRNQDFPIIISTRGYNAYSSAGFVEVVADYRGGNTRISSRVIGIQGMPFQTRKGLSVMSNPMEVLVLRPGTNISMLETHARRKPNEGWHSNPDAAAAAIQGIKLRAQIRPNSVFIVEGQSDYAQAWELAAEYEAYSEPFAPEFPEEFRSDRFTHEAFVASALRAKARRGSETEEETRGKMFIYLNLLIADNNEANTDNGRSLWPDGKDWSYQLLSEATRRLVGNGEEFSKAIVSLAEGMRHEGWKLGIDTSVANHFLQGISPEGIVVVSGWGICHGPKEWERRLVYIADIDGELRNQLVETLNAQDENSRRWIAHIGA